MTAEIANGARACGRCGRDIRAGEPLYRVTRARLVRCEPCAWTLGGPLPRPVPFIIPTRRTTAPSDMLPFQRPQMAAAVRNHILDARQRQAGEREPGEEG